MLLVGRCDAFAPGPLSTRLPLSPSRNFQQDIVILTNLNAKKKGKKGGKGFSKKQPEPVKKANTQTMDSSSASEYSGGGDLSTNTEFVGLSSIEDALDYGRPEIDIDPNAPVADRTQSILKDKYGLRSFEEQQGDVRAAERKAENSKRMKKIKDMTDEEFDLFEFLPPMLVKGIDLFLKGGLTVTTILFILAGIGITFEAWAVSTKNTLPEWGTRLIEDTIEPNFTAGGIVLLLFSISLGVFATAQLGSKKSAYREDM